MFEKSEHLAEFIPQHINKLALLLNVENTGKGVKQGILEFYKKCRVPNLKEMGMDMALVKDIAHHATLGAYYALAPKKASEDELSEWLKEMYEQ